MATSQAFAPAEGSCAVCKLVVKLTQAGVVRRHGGKAKGRECAGSGRTPFEAMPPRGGDVGGSGMPASSSTHTGGMISSTLQSLSYSQPLDLVAEVRRRLVSSSVPTMDHIPSGARAVCSSKITSILNAVTRDVFQLSGWLDLLTFAPVVLAKPRRGEKVTISPNW